MRDCLVLLSGGQDSCTCLAWAVENFKRVFTVSFDYGQRHRIELDCSCELARIAGVEEHFVIPVSSLKVLGSSALVGGGDVSSCHPLKPGLPASFVPGRNYVFFGLAAVKAFQLGIHDLVGGMCQTDYSGYPDCRENSLRAVQVALSLCLGYEVYIHLPLMWKTKAETVLMMKDLGRLDWYRFTHTCYEGRRPPCGQCPACLLRAEGFRQAGVKDPLLE